VAVGPRQFLCDANVCREMLSHDVNKDLNAKDNGTFSQGQGLYLGLEVVLEDKN